jgi:hypothetical protein
MTRKIALELVAFGITKETVTLPADEARALLAKPMTRGWRWSICGPDTTGELPDDDARFAADCAACKISNPYDHC